MTSPNISHKGETRSADIRPRAYSYIRFSSPEQAKGDSLQRQMELAEQYAESYGLELDTELTFRDLGVSAYRGLNVETGELRTFLKAVGDGIVKPGSVLLVESLDRISRRHARKAVRVLEEIVETGVDVVTLQDGKRYSAESLDGLDFIWAILVLIRGHEESATKSKRVAAAWKRKREKLAEGHKLTKRGPEWLRLSDDKRHFEIVPERAPVIPMIFQLKVDGIGSESIARKLNQQDVWKPQGRRNPDGGWRKSYVEKILHGRAVIGEFRPHKMENGKRVPDGEPIIDYFPRVVDQELFDRVQAIFARRAALPGHGGGVNGRVANLFGGGLARCALCGSTMAHVNKGPKPKGGEYLQCDKAKRGLGCDKKLVRYDWLEPLLLYFTRGLEPTMLLPDADERKARATAARYARQQAREGELTQAQKQIENLTESIARTPDKAVRETLEGKLATVLKRRTELETELAQMDVETAEQSATPEAVAEQIRDIEDLLTRMDTLRGEERSELRRRLRHELQQLIDRIEIKPTKSGTALTLYFRDGAYCNLRIDKKGALRLANDGTRIAWLDADGNVLDIDDPDDDPGGGAKQKRRERQRRVNAKIAKALKRQGLNLSDPTIAGECCGHPPPRSQGPVSPVADP